MTNKLTRAEVYTVIDGERDYQDLRWGATLSGERTPGPGQSGGDRSVDEFVLYILGYTNDAVNLASHFSKKEDVLAVVRKIAALSVACMEQHGAPKR
jgi:hypothetical protein